MKHPLPLLTALLLALLATLHAADDFVVTHRATIFQHVGEDPKDPRNTSGFNHAPSGVLLPDGRVMAAWFSSPFEGAPSQRIVRAFSQDQGRTWSKAERLQDFPERADFDPSFVASGKSMFFFFAATEPTRVFFRRSDDSGASWTEPADLGQPGHTMRAGGIRLATGELLVPLHRTGTRAGGVMKSTDEGRTWKRFGQVANPEGQGGEPTIAQTKSGRVLMILRTKDGKLWRAHSDDRGETWSAPEIIPGLTGTSSASHLLCLREGTLVLTHNPGPVPARFPLLMRLSRDEGATWSDPFTLADRPENVSGWQASYPSVIELPDGSLFAVWTQILNTKSALYGDIQCARLSLAPTQTGAGQPVQPEEFGHARITDAWQTYAKTLTFGKGQTLALVDDGCKLSRPEWTASVDGVPKVRVAYDAVDGDDDPKHEGRGYHGSTIGIPSSLNYQGKWGVAYNNQVAVIRGLECCHGKLADSRTLAAALQWILDNHEKHRITTVNLAPVDDQAHAEPVATEIDAKLAALRKRGLWVSAPAGNHNFTNGISWPACQPDCFAIGAVKPGKDEVHLDRHEKIALLVPARATSSSNAIACGAAMLLREAIETTGYNWQADGATLPDAMMAIFQKTGKPVDDPATKRTYRRLDAQAALEHVFAHGRK